MEPVRPMTRLCYGSRMHLTIGLGGREQHTCTALVLDQRLIAACEQERATRVRAAGPNRTGLPDEALDLLLERNGLTRQDIASVAAAESFITPAEWGRRPDIDHHLGHAAASYLTSPWDAAATVVLDHDLPGLSVWVGNGPTLSRHEWTWQGEGLAALFFRAAAALGFHGTDQGQRFDAVARLTPDVRDSRVDGLLNLDEHSIRTAPDWLGTLETLRGGAPLAGPESQALASSVQARFGDLLLDVLHRVRAATRQPRVCLGGSLFYSSFMSSLAKRSGIYDEVFVPVNPGNAGLSAGTALLATGAAPRTISPFLGPAFSANEVKAVLDNCKLHYEWGPEGEVLDRTVAALMRGHLVGWFDGAMEWGPRALGARSILASPLSPYVLENLNRFLKHRAPWRSYALSGLDVDVAQLFDGPTTSPYMECDYRSRDAERFRHVLPHPQAALRIQTVGADARPRLTTLLEAFKQATGIGVLVNTSFNGFYEPIVCTARDAVRVYYGTGLDMLVIDRFILTK
jgi:carbamoyltransferase